MPDGWQPRARSDAAYVAESLKLLRAADQVEMLNAFPAEFITEVIHHLPQRQILEILDVPDLVAAADVVQALPKIEVEAVLDGISSDRAAAILRRLDAGDRRRVLDLAAPETRDRLLRMLSYADDSAGSLMADGFVAVPASWSVGETLQHIRKFENRDKLSYGIYISNPVDGSLMGTAALIDLITGDSEAPISSVAQPLEPVTTSPMADREDVARQFAKYDLMAIPVVDDSRRMLGIVTVDDVIDALNQEGTEDAQKFGGTAAFDRRYMDLGFWDMVRKRSGWLAVLFLGEMLTTSAMQHFEAEIAKAVVLTLFIPLIMSSGGNSGSQATSLIIRSLALRELRLSHWWRVALRELPTGVVLGGVLGSIGVARIAVWQLAGFHDYGPHWALVALTVGTALVTVVTFGSLVGSLLPFGLKALNLDPASASAPFVATLVDVWGIVIYFTIAIFFLGGTLL